MFESVKRLFSSDVYVPADPAKAEDFDPDYVPSVDEPGDITEVGDIPDAEVAK